MKKLFSIILTVAMIASCIAPSAFASEGATVIKHNSSGDVAYACDFAYITDGQEYSLGYKIIDAAAKTVKVCGFTNWPYTSTELIIPSEVQYNGDTYTVTQVDDNAFGAFGASDAYKDRITSVRFPSTILSIGAEAFKYNYGILTISSDGQTGFLPQNLEKLGNGAFFSCTNLAVDLIIPGTLGSISLNAFSQCTNITSVTINPGVKEICASAFYNVILPDKLVIPETVSKINLTAFQRMKGLKEMYFNHTDTIEFSGTADTSVWKYPTYTLIDKYGGCMGGSNCAYGYTTFYAKNSTVLEAVKEKMLSPITVTGSDDDAAETQKCKDYFSENNFVIDDTNGLVEISAPVSGSTITSLPVTVSGTASGGSVVKVSVNGAETGTAEVLSDGSWSCALSSIPDGVLTFSARLYDGEKSAAISEVIVSADIEANNTHGANIDCGVFYDSVKSVGGTEKNDSLALGINRNQFEIVSDIANPDKPYGVLADAPNDAATGGELGIPSGTSNIDIVFKDGYTGAAMIGDLLAVIKTNKAQSGKWFEMNVQYSTTDNPDTFESLYKWSRKTHDVEKAYYYIRIKDLKTEAANVKKIRLTIRWTGDTDMLLCEVDFNDKQDGPAVASAKENFKNKIAVSRMFTSNAVLQRNQKIKVWGTGCIDGETVTVTFNGQTASSTASGGKWAVELEPMSEGGPYEMKITGSNQPAENEITLENIMVGEVWLASGQSNMQFPVGTLLGNALKESYVAPYGADTDAQRAAMQKDVDESADDNLRLYTVGILSSAVLCDEIYTGSWETAAPDTVKSFSATAYYFARKLRQELGSDMPIGIINSSVGGTGIEKWVNEEIINSDIDYSVYKDGKQCCYYNAMINPLTDYVIKGVIWYQGESNAGRSDLYTKLFPQLISTWRGLFNNSDMPFLFVNIAPESINNNDIRESQLKTLITVPNTAMAVITDAGDMEDLHPKYKKSVGDRLGLGAMALAYGKDIEYMGPIYKSMYADGNRLVLSFNHGGGLKSLDGEALRGFEISADGSRFVSASAEIIDNKVCVYSNEVDSPKAVRYGWKVDNVSNADPVAATLYNEAGLPAAPFRATTEAFGSISAVFEDSSNNEITSGDVPSDGIVNVNYSYKNNSVMGADIVIAVYDNNNTLKGIDISKVKFDYVGINSLKKSFDLGDNPGGNIKIMVLEDMQSISPVAEARSFK